MKFAARAILAAFFLTAALPARACFLPPPELTKHHRELVADSATIVMARALEPEASESGSVPRFQPIEVLKGDVPGEFILGNGRYAGSSENDESLNDDFDAHRNAAVWDRKLTRQWNNSMCEMEPAFVPGETYLVFLDHPHWRAYELIRSKDDLWLKAVRNLIADPSRPAGLAVTVPQWLSLASRAFIVSFANCEAGELDVVEILLGEAEETWFPNQQGQTNYHGSRGTCEVGGRMLVVVYNDREFGPSHTVSALFDVDNGTVDFSKAIEGEMHDGRSVGGTELEVIGDRKISLDELRAALSRERLK